MQKKRARIAETIVTSLCDFAITLIIVSIATAHYNIPFMQSAKLWILGIVLRVATNYYRRYLFSKYNNKLEQVLNC
tara:strand:+ start:2999 stop:3226 length:228 start_codon:yes stop_codon:yes gene_type:complete